MNLRELKADIKLTEENFSEKSDVNPVKFEDAEGVFRTIGGLIWDDEEECWMLQEGEDDGE